MTKKLTNYDPAAALVDDEETAFFMADAFETGDAAYIAKALGVVARAKEMRAARATPGENLARIREVLGPSMSDLATTFGVSRQSVYNWLDGEPIAAENAAKLHDLALALEATDLLAREGVMVNAALPKQAET
jgi:DNA-binding phage protein